MTPRLSGGPGRRGGWSPSMWAGRDTRWPGGCWRGCPRAGRGPCFFTNIFSVNFKLILLFQTCFSIKKSHIRLCKIEYKPRCSYFQIGRNIDPCKQAGRAGVRCHRGRDPRSVRLLQPPRQRVLL